jgi:tRNA pseudouridine55 synthase
VPDAADRVDGAIAAVGPGDVLVAIVERRGPQLKVVTGFPAEEGA